MTQFRRTRGLGSGSCSRRLDRFSRFEVNQLQIPLVSYGVKIKNRRSAWEPEVRCGPPGCLAGVLFSPYLQNGSFDKDTDKKDGFRNASALEEAGRVRFHIDRPHFIFLEKSKDTGC